MAGMTSKNWSLSSFETVADRIDKDYEVLSGVNKIRKCTKPMEDHIQCRQALKMALIIYSPLMNQIADNADFMQCDVTYDETRDLFNANDTLMKWMIIGQIRLNKQNSNAYCLAFKKLLESPKCQSTWLSHRLE